MVQAEQNDASQTPRAVKDFDKYNKENFIKFSAKELHGVVDQLRN